MEEEVAAREVNHRAHTRQVCVCVCVCVCVVCVCLCLCL